MTEMRRVTISMPEAIDKKILELRKDDRFVRCSYSEIVRMVLERALDEVKENQNGRFDKGGGTT